MNVGRLLWRILRVAIGALFLYAGALKAWDPIGFAGDIENYHLVPWAFGVRFAFYLPWLEIVCGVALIIGRAKHAAVAILAALMVVFIAASMIAKARGLDVTCGCFGHALRNFSFASHLALDVAILSALIALGARVWRAGQRSRSVATIL